MIVTMKDEVPAKVSDHPNFCTAGAPVPKKLRDRMNKCISNVPAHKNAGYAAAMAWFVSQPKEVHREWIDVALRDWIRPALSEAPNAETPDLPAQIQQEAEKEVASARKRSTQNAPKRKQLPPDPERATAG